MKLRTLSLLALFIVSAAQAADYDVDASHSNVDFKIRHMMSKVNGNFGKFTGTFSFDAKKPEAAKGVFTVEAASINTNNEKRDGHLKGDDFFNVGKFPTLTFNTTGFKKAGKGFAMSGDLTMLGVTKPVTFNVEYLGAGKDPWGNSKAGFSATGKINRKDFGMVWNKALDAGGVLLGEEVEITLNIEAAEKVAAAK
jgi:polyisoprenoid-binding protein YceI